MKNKKKLFRIASISFIVLGIIFVLFGILKLIFINYDIKNNKETNSSFEILSHQYNEKNKVSILIFSGFFMSVGIGTTFFILSNKYDSLNDESNLNANSVDFFDNYKIDNKEESTNFHNYIDDNTHCVHCGAPIENRSLQKCDYCGYDV